MTRQDSSGNVPEADDLPADFEQLAVSESGLDRGDVLQIREKLRLTPTERLKAAQDFMNTVIASREQNGERSEV